MAQKILGLDLGTNSIGWAIRYNEPSLDNQIIDYGVTVFRKGMGDGKSGEFSLAAERRKNRSKRRLYNAKRYRKWELLKVLIENKMCPLKLQELRLWSIGNWINGKNQGRQYPIHNSEWMKWLAMDPIYFGDKGTSKNKKTIRKSPYDLRCELMEKFEDEEQTRKYKIGRSLYHLVQRRGFKTSRKSGKSSYGESEILKKFYEKYPDKVHWKSAQVFTFLQSDECTDTELKLHRIRKETGVLQRKFYEEELSAICEKQQISEELRTKLKDAIYFVRPLRTQKGLVGKCTLEKGKPRIPISHPAFEEFRALQFINNLQWREVGSKKTFEPIPMKLKKDIFENLFFRKLERGNNKGKVTTDGYFEFDEIIKRHSENGKYEFNYKNKPNVSTCPVIAGMMNVFEDDWKNKFIQDENRIGVNWDGLILKYKVQYGSKRQKENGIIPAKVGKERNLDYEGIWHLLFDFLQTRDKEDELKNFCKEVLGWPEERANEFVNIDIQQGYGSLSRSAIVKILPYLQEGYIYPEAVSFANLSKVLGKENFHTNKEAVKQSITTVLKKIDEQKERLNIVNGLIQKYFGDIENIKTKRLDEKLKNEAAIEVEKKLKSFFGEDNWNTKTEDERKECFHFVLKKYLNFLNGEQNTEEKVASLEGKNPERDYYKLPRLDEAVKKVLREKFSASEKGVEHLYHPSDIEIYPKASIKQIVDRQTGKIIKEMPQLGDPQPPSKGFKNPMAMRTMYELKRLVNYLLEVGKIDRETRIVIEIARELNDANYRKAYSDWIADKEKENQEYAKAIVEMYGIQHISDDDYNKFRAAVEQLTEIKFDGGQGKEFGKKYKEFVKTFLIGEKKNDVGENEEEEEIEDLTQEPIKEVDHEYLMYLILTRDNFVRLLNSKTPDTKKFVRQIIKTSKGFKEKRNALKEMLTRYRLWRQQQFQCIYTGRYIPFTELFSINYQIEHTIPCSISFDSELKNLTVCDAVYNNAVKKNVFPTQCPNYRKTAKCITAQGEIECPPIKETVERLIKPKVEGLNNRIQNLKATAKKIKDWEVDKKNANIRLRHYLQFELDYWEGKYFTFTVERRDWKDKWKNSQLVDTQIVTKYARAYMKSLFNRVDVQKARVVSEFKKIYQLKGNEQKDRSRHSHHAIDAAVLTLIPGSAKREEILGQYYFALEKDIKFHIKPYPTFDITQVESIDNNVLINHVGRDKTLVPTYKRLRKRGEVQLTKDGKEIVMQGDSIRGQLHKETFFGAIKVPERNEDGYPVKHDGKYVLRQNKKTGDDEIWIISRRDLKDLKAEDFEEQETGKEFIVDELLRRHIKKQLDEGVPLQEVVDFQRKRIRHIRCRVPSGGGGYLSKAIELKTHSHPPKQKHKKFVLVQNSDDGNYLYLLYEKGSGEKLERKARIISLFDLANEYNVSNTNEIWNDRALNQTEDGISLKYILKVGQMAIFYSGSREELKGLEKQDLQGRVFRIYKFNEVGTPYIYLQNHIEARSEEELGKLERKKDGYTEFDKDNYQYRLKLKANKLNCIFHGKDFEIKPDGEIIFKF